MVEGLTAGESDSSKSTPCSIGFPLTQWQACSFHMCLLSAGLTSQEMSEQSTLVSLGMSFQGIGADKRPKAAFFSH